MIYRNNSGTLIQPGVEQSIIEWESDGVTKVMGFMGTGTYSAEFSLYVEDDDEIGALGDGAYYSYQTSPSLRTAYVADRAFIVPAGKRVILKIYHESTQSETFKATLLG